MEVFFRLLSHLIWFCYMLHFTKAVLPLFQKYEPTIITEGLSPGSPYYTFKATDANPLHNITYSLDSKGSEWFNIDSSSGVATVKKTIDKEAMTNLFQYKVFASDGFNNKAVADVNQQILDINDNPPVFTNLPKTINIKEDLSVGSSVFEVSATDADEGPFGSSEYIIESGDEEGIFDIPNLAAGKITLKKTLDFDEGSKQFVLGILAKNTASPYLNATSVLTINVVNVDDLGAKFVKNLYEATIVQDSFVGTAVTTIQAEDRDALNATIHYKIYQETNPDNVYTINNNTGEMTVNGRLNIGTQLLVVTATSTNHPPAFTVVKVKVASMLNMSYIVSVVEGQSDVVIFNLDPAEQFYNITGGNFSIMTSAQSSLFTMDGKNLKVGSKPLDRETREQYQLHIAVQKDGSLIGMVMVTIIVLDINDNKPSFQGDLPYNGSVPEDADIGQNILRVTAEDVDDGLNGTVKYAITGGDRSDVFSINNITGMISSAGSLDRETTAKYDLTVQAYDGGSPPKTNTTTVIINVVDVNDNIPVLNQTPIAKSLAEWTANGTQVAVIVAADADTGDNGRITYAIQEGADGKFVIDPNSGVITTIGGLSYNINPRYTIVVNARDNGSPPRSATAVVYVNVEPRTNKSYTDQVTEGAANLSVLNLLSVEQDYKVSGASFSFISGNDDNHFVIDHGNKELEVGSQPLDRERQKEYKLEIQVEKDGINRGIAMVTINVLDINDNSPSFQGSFPYNANIKEDTVIGASIVKVLATDGDAGLNGTVKYAIASGNEQGYFSFDNITGQISLAGSLDRETTSQYNLSVQAYDGGSRPMTNTTTVIINVVDVNDNSPVMNKTSFTKILSEWAINGTQVALIVATDADTGDNGRITYAIQEGADGKFVIDPNSGVITTTGGLSYNIKPGYTIVVNALDHGPSPRSATAVVSVSVEPKTNETYTVHVTEGRANEVAMNLLIVEQDYNVTGANLSISAGNVDGRRFEIDPATKDLKVGTLPLDRELKDEYILRITLKKDGKVIGVAMIIINVLDVNDNSPAFEGSTPYNITLKEDTEIGESILKVTAKDWDDGANGTVKYNITAGNEQGCFTINNIKGEISISKMLDRETTAKYDLTVQAYDGGSPPMTNTTTVIIIVRDVNDNSPVISPTIIIVNVSEATGTGEQVAQVSASDADVGVNSKITYSIRDGSYGKFIIDQTSGAITVNGSLSFKERPKYMVIVKAIDNGASPRSASVLVDINITSTGLNQNSPVFTKSEYLGGVYKDTSDDQLILTVSATDADSGTSGEVTYILTDNPAESFLHLEPSLGQLRTANSFETKEGEIYNVTAQAVDKGSTPRTSVEAYLLVYVLRVSHSLVITSGRTQDYILTNLEEFRGVLGELTNGTAFIKSVRPKPGVNESSEITINVVDSLNKEELSSADIIRLLVNNEEAINSNYEKWKIGSFERPKVAAIKSPARGLSAVVGAMMCLALLIGIGGIIMIIILIKKRSERERVRKASRVTFNDKPLYINIDGNLPVSRSKHVEYAQEAYERSPIIPEETSSVSSEDVQTSPDVMDYFNPAYVNDEHEGDNQGHQYVHEGDTVNFGTFFPPPPTQPPPPVPDSDAGDSAASEEVSIESDEEPDYYHAVLPPHEDFADPNHTPQDIGGHIEDSPTNFRTDSTSLLNPSSYKDALLHDTTFGISALGKSSNPELTTEL